MVFGILALELIVLYFLSLWVTQAIFTFFMLVFRVRAIAVSFLLVLQFPGTVLHELSHLFTAEILGVRTGKMTLEPESIRGDTIQSGSVTMEGSDPFRRYLIGLAPLSWGMIALTAIAYFLPSILTSVTNSGLPVYQNTNTYLLAGLGYLLFAISNTMFPSHQDVKGFWPYVIVILLLGGGIYFLGLRIALTGWVLELVMRVTTTLTQSLGVVLAINTALLVIIWLLTLLLTRVLRVRIVASPATHSPHR